MLEWCFRRLLELVSIGFELYGNFTRQCTDSIVFMASSIYPGVFLAYLYINHHQKQYKEIVATVNAITRLLYLARGILFSLFLADLGRVLR